MRLFLSLRVVPRWFHQLQNHRGGTRRAGQLPVQISKSKPSTSDSRANAFTFLLWGASWDDVEYFDTTTTIHFTYIIDTRSRLSCTDSVSVIALGTNHIAYVEKPKLKDLHTLDVCRQKPRNSSLTDTTLVSDNHATQSSCK